MPIPEPRPWRAGRPGPLPRLQVSANRRFLVTAAGEPFCWLADTAWELFHRLDREQALHYLEDRAARGYTLIQAVALAELAGLDDPNPYGHRPFRGPDPLAPEEGYWAHVDFVVAAANRLGLYLGLLPTWGDKWNQKGGAGPEIFTPANAEGYGEWLGHRYREAGLVWILGGDRPVESELHRQITQAMAYGLRRGDGGAHLLTFHPAGGQGSAEHFHGEQWLDFNLRQNGHTAEYTGRYDQTRTDFERQPVKPVIDGEPLYEDHPLSFKAGELGHSVAADVRRALYWDLFSGACGHTYGHHSVWQMWEPGRKAVNHPLLPWRQALAQPGADQMRHGRDLLESRPYLSRLPDAGLILADPVPTAGPGAGRYRFAATRDEAGRYAMVYAPVGRPFAVDLGRLAGTRVRAWWFDPRCGQAQDLGTFAGGGPQTFTPPAPGEALDWVLVLDDEAQGFPPPGRGVA